MDKDISKNDTLPFFCNIIKFFTPHPAGLFTVNMLLFMKRKSRRKIERIHVLTVIAYGKICVAGVGVMRQILNSYKFRISDIA